MHMMKQKKTHFLWKEWSQNKLDTKLGHTKMRVQHIKYIHVVDLGHAKVNLGPFGVLVVFGKWHDQAVTSSIF